VSRGRVSGFGALHGSLVVLRVELSRAVASRRVLVLLGLAAAAPVPLALVLAASASTPQDTLFGRWVGTSGFALPLLVLGYAGAWVLPLVGGLVAAEMFTIEDLHGTWPLVLSRSRSAGEVYAGKALAAGLVATATTGAAALASLAAGVVSTGTAPLVGLSGSLLPAASALGSVLASWVSVLPPVLAFTALGVLGCLAVRRSPLGFLVPAAVGVVLQLVAFLPALDVVRPLLPTTAFTAWHGLVRDDSYAGPVLVGTLTSLVLGAACLAGGWLLLRGRDLTEDG